MLVKSIDITRIDPGTRYRKKIDQKELDNLKQSIIEDGLINPITVTPYQGDDGRFDYTLIAGGRRYTAYLQLYVASLETETHRYKHVDCHIMEDVDEYNLRCLELAENLHRKNMEYDEELALKSEIHRLQSEKLQADHSNPNVEASITEVAELLGESRQNVARDLELAEYSKIFPELLEAKNKANAHRMLAKIKERMADKLKADSILNKPKVSDFSEPVDFEAPVDRHAKYNTIEKQLERLQAAYFVKDCREGFANLENSVDLIEIDPPYAIDLAKLKKSADDSAVTAMSYNEIKEEDYIPLMTEVAEASFKALKDDGWCLLWFAPHPWFDTLFNIFIEAGFKGSAIPIIWDKGIGQTNNPGLYLGNSYEMCFYFRKTNKATINKKGTLNVIKKKPVPTQLKKHPTERPIEMITELLTIFLRPGEFKKVYVPFLGSGNTILACSNHGSHGWGCDLSQEYKNGYVASMESKGSPGNFKSYIG